MLFFGPFAVFTPHPLRSTLSVEYLFWSCWHQNVIKPQEGWQRCSASWSHLCLMGLQEVDWEVEMAFVIGRRGKHIKVVIGSAPTETVTSNFACRKSELHLHSSSFFRRKRLCPTWPVSPSPTTSAHVTGRWSATGSSGCWEKPLTVSVLWGLRW